MPAPTDPESGAVLVAGRYELLTLLGRGGMADVYRARDRVLSRDVAVKMLRETSTEGSDRARFVAEGRILASLSHAGLVTILDAGAEPEPFVVMELVEGPTLAQVIARGPLPLEQVALIATQVGEALAYVHDRGVVHRDVKPGNVLLGPGRRVRLADFGIARLVGDTARHTRTGQAIGTAAFLAPEQITGREVTGAADVYSLGLVLLEALTGRREYPGTPTEAAFARLHRPPRIPDELPAVWRDLLGAMTADEPSGRPRSHDIAARLRGPATTVPPEPETEPVTTADAATEPLTSAPIRTQLLTAPASRAPRPGPPAWLANRLVVAVAAAVVALLVISIGLGLRGGDDGGTSRQDPGDASTRSTTTSPQSSPQSSPRSSPRTSPTPAPTPAVTPQRTSPQPAVPVAPKKHGKKPKKDHGHGHGH